MTFKPQILQKCSFHGIILSKEIISKAREEVNELCVIDLAKEIKNKQSEISKIKNQGAQKFAPNLLVKEEEIIDPIT